MATQKSTSFGKLKRPAGKEFRSGTLGESIDDLYADIDDAFESLELGTPYAPVKLATIAVLSPATASYTPLTLPKIHPVLISVVGV